MHDSEESQCLQRDRKHYRCNKEFEEQSLDLLSGLNSLSRSRSSQVLHPMEFSPNSVLFLRNKVLRGEQYHKPNNGTSRASQEITRLVQSQNHFKNNYNWLRQSGLCTSNNEQRSPLTGGTKQSKRGWEGKFIPFEVKRWIMSNKVMYSLWNIIPISPSTHKKVKELGKGVEEEIKAQHKIPPEYGKMLNTKETAGREWTKV